MRIPNARRVRNQSLVFFEPSGVCSVARAVLQQCAHRTTGFVTRPSSIAVHTCLLCTYSEIPGVTKSLYLPLQKGELLDCQAI